jgi:hypothetical protein
MVTKDIEADGMGTVHVRGLKRGEIKALRKEGINFGAAIPLEKIEEYTDAALKIILPPDLYEQLDEFLEADLLRIHREMIRLTYPTDEQEKNSG